jgi:TolB-like protein
VWDAQTGSLIRKDAAGPGSVLRVAFGGQGTLLALGGDDGRISVVDLRSGTIKEVARHAKPVTSVAFTVDGRVGASGDTEGNILLWDPDRGAPGALKDGGHRKDILILSFNAGGNLLSVSKDLRVVAWDVPGKRPLRRGTLQSEVAGRTVVPNAAAVDPEGTTLMLGSQLVSEPRGGFLTDRRGPASPADLRRDNVLLPYVVATGISGDPIGSAEFEAQYVAVSPSACFAFFTSSYRNQARMHVWSLIEHGDDLVRTSLPAQASAIALEPGARFVAVATEPGRIMVWRVSGATAADCDAYAKKAAPTTAERRITLGPETDPLIQEGADSKIAVLRFETTGLDATLGDGVAEMVAGQLSNRPGIVIVERAAVDSILKELQVQRSGLTTADAVRIGRGLNARKVLFGSVRRFGEDTFVVLVRIVDVETQQIQGSREVSCEHCKEQDLPRAVEALRRIVVN